MFAPRDVGGSILAQDFFSHVSRFFFGFLIRNSLPFDPNKCIFVAPFQSIFFFQLLLPYDLHKLLWAKVRSSLFSNLIFLSKQTVRAGRLAPNNNRRHTLVQNDTTFPISLGITLNDLKGYCFAKIVIRLSGQQEKISQYFFRGHFPVFVTNFCDRSNNATINFYIFV